MKTFLSIDAGNTNPHVGHFYNGDLLTTTPLKQFEMADQPFSFSLSDVSKVKISNIFNRGKQYHLRDYFLNNHFLDMPVHYQKNLGDDRLFQAQYLFSNYVTHKKPYLLIDSGTFVTMDLITTKGYLGGYILSGIDTYFDTFIKGANLPSKIKSEYNINNRELPQTTDDSLNVGLDFLYWGAIQKLLQNYPSAHLFFTGSKAQIIKEIFTKYTSNTNYIEDQNLIHHAIYDCALKVQKRKKV